MSDKHEKQESWMMTEYVKLLGKFSFVLVLATVVLGLLASSNYESSAQIIEGIEHRELAQSWTIILLWVPLILQLLVLFFLSVRVWKQKNSEAVRYYFQFYFFRIFSSSFIYVWLWWRYTKIDDLGASEDAFYNLGWLSFLGIILLLYFVVQATYLITRSSFRNDKRLFTEKDIKESQHQSICEQLKAASKAASSNKEDNSTKTTNGNSAFLLESAVNASPGTEKKEVTPEVQIIHEWMLKDRDYKVHRVTYKGAVNDLDIPHFIEALNRLVCSRRFYSYRDENSGGQHIPRHIIETSNREYIQKHLLKERQSEEEAKAQREQPRDATAIVREFVGGLSSLTAETMGSLLGGQKRTDRRIGRRKGIAMFPFYTMVFFFSIFLCIAYLFGLAFAFEDKYVQLASMKKHGALFMSDDLLEDAVQQPTPKPSSTPLNYELNELQKVFYFNSGVAGIKVEKIENTNGDTSRYVSQNNQESLEKVAPAIKDALNAGKQIQIELVGRADDTLLSKGAYASNYEVALARIKSVRFLLQQTLIGEGVPPSKLDAIDWIETPLSSDASLLPERRKKNPEDNKGENNLAFLVLADSSGQSERTDQRAIEQYKADQQRIDQLIHDQKEENLKKAGHSFYEEVNTWWVRVDKSPRKGQLTDQAIYALYYDIDAWIDVMTKKDSATAANIKDKIERELFQIEDLKGSKRAVEVYLQQFPPPQPAPQPEPHFKRMALMDYLYFAMYTITTTGYGDIKPMTPYTKFLCTLANMTEFFFIVVFFNTLLSLKRAKEEAP